MAPRKGSKQSRQLTQPQGEPRTRAAIAAQNSQTSENNTINTGGQGNTTPAMPGSFAPPTIVSNDPSIVHRVGSPERRSPNPFLITTTPAGSPRLQSQGPQTAISRISTQSTTPGVRLASNLQTPRINVPVQFGSTGVPNFGPSVSQGNAGLSQRAPLGTHQGLAGSNVRRNSNLSPVPESPVQNLFRDVDTTTREPLRSIEDEADLSYVSEQRDEDYDEDEDLDQRHQESNESSETIISDADSRLQVPLTTRTVDNEGNVEYEAAIAELGSVGNPVVGITEQGQFQRHYYTFPSCHLHHVLLSREADLEYHQTRYQRAVQLASEYYGRLIPYDAASQVFNRAGRSYFEQALEMIAALFDNLLRGNNGLVYAFRIDREIYQELNTELLKLRRENEEAFTALGYRLPALPRWGPHGDIAEAWTANDFEIIAAAYRSEVEIFLQAIFIARSQVQATTRQNTNRTLLRSPADSIVSHRRRSERTDQRQTSRSPQIALANNRLEDEPTIMMEQEALVGTAGDSRINERNNTPEARVQQRPARPRRSVHLNSTTFGLSAQTSSSNRMRAMFGRNRGTTTFQTRGGRGGFPPDDDDSSSSSDEESNNGNGEGGNLPRNQPQMRPPRQPTNTGQDVSNPRTPSQPQFETKLKVDLIPTWDGNIETLARWILKINRISERSDIINQQLGVLVPTRLTNSAETWYYSQSPELREEVEADWPTLRQAIGEYYMNEGYLKDLKSRANNAKYRQRGYEKETPSEFFIRKLELLQLSYNYNDVELINEIMRGVPEIWTPLLNPKNHKAIEDFRVTFKYYENSLMRMDYNSRPRNDFNPYNSRSNNSRNPFTNDRNNTRVNVVGWSKSTSSPPYPKDDTNVSAKATPEQKGGRACRHCGSFKHWDPECKYARKGEKRVRVNMVSIDEEDSKAQEEYDALYYEEISDDEGDFQ